MTDKKSRKIPIISPDRLDNTPGITSVGSTKEEKRAHAFLKGNEPIQTLTVRFPVEMYETFREYAFRHRLKMNQVVVDLVKTYLAEHHNDSN